MDSRLGSPGAISRQCRAVASFRVHSVHFHGLCKQKENTKSESHLNFCRIVRLKTQAGVYFTPAPVFLNGVRRVVILLRWPFAAVVKPRHRMTIGADYCRSRHVQA